VRDEATHNLLAMLPPRELEITQLVGARSICTATKLASHLNITEKTARNYINNIKIQAEPYYGWRPSWIELVHYFTRYYSVE
jgi:DNA-binding CsgD family transcriptional regulator